MEFGELTVALGNRPRGIVSQILGDGSAQEVGARFDAFVGTGGLADLESELISSLAEKSAEEFVSA